MTDSANLPGDYRARYAIESFPNGDGVLVDLTTGSYFKLNTSAVRIVENLLMDGSAAGAAARVSRSLMVPIAEATGMVAEIAERLSLGTTPEPPAGPLRYVGSNDGSAIFEEDGRAIFSIAAGSPMLRLRTSPRDLSNPLALYLQALVPKLLAVLEIPVLHAAACQIGDSSLAFSGKSGAGKTTTARAFERMGTHLLSEDLVILSLSSAAPAMYEKGEWFARKWASRVAQILENTPELEIDFTDLSGCRQGPEIPLETMWFIDVLRRASNEIGLRRLSASDGALALLSNGMLATFHAHHWRDFLRRSRFIAERTRLSEATMPDGVRYLDAAAARYILNSTS